MDIILYNIIAAICCLLVGYIFGSIPTSIVIGKLFFHQDPRDYGSKNAGGTNSGRLWGKKVGLIVIIIDMIKTIAPIWICWAILTFVNFGEKPLMQSIQDGFHYVDTTYVIRWSVYWLAPLGTIVGHCWPIFAGFKGGKGVSSFMGITCGTSWLVGFLPGLSYLLFLKWKKHVSLASIAEAVLLPITFWTWAILCHFNVLTGFEWLATYGATLRIDFVAATVITIMGIIVIIRHHENIARLRNGTERKITWMK